MNSMINTRSVGSDRCHSHVVRAVVLAVVGLLLPSLASALTLATTSVAKDCRVLPLTDKKEYPFAPYGQDLACDLSVTNPDGDTATAVGRANAGFGSGFPFIGNVNVNAEAKGSGSASFRAYATIGFEIQSLKSVTWPSEGVPIIFSTRGEGSATASGPNEYGNLTGSAMAEGGAMLVGQSNFPSYQFSMLDTNTGGFDKTVSVNIWFPNYEYGMNINAGCTAFAYNGGSATCGAAVDPFLGFDQATFDATMGANTYPLNEYFKIVVSENVVPIPPAVWLFGSGLLGLIGVARRKSAKAA
ncbi:MAG TPA: VPLPA-CTERM sorting domain-containing protein [Candidatus Methylomirabilis sp.]|nr:VPLPA-CTERM sorting domain-containing protein [Candidatus Methylomirabilis sp.]